MAIAWRSSAAAASWLRVLVRRQRSRSALPLGVAALALVLTAGCRLKDPIMVIPPEMLSNAEVLPVSGRSGGLLWNPPIEFGRFRTTEVKRGWRSDSSWNWWGIDVDERWDASRATAFVLAGPQGERWDARCLSRAHSHHLDKPVGFHIGLHGFGVDRRTVEAVSYAVYQCAFQDAGGGRWQLLLSDADPSGFGGVVMDDRHAVLARVTAVREQTGRPYTYSVQQPLGFLVDAGGGSTAAVERAFQGKVVMARTSSPAQAMMLATVATALLVWEPLTI
jgi:hypothetical protein